MARPPSGPRWAHEIKFDGYRTQLHVHHGRVLAYSRNGHDWTDRYTAVAEEAATLPLRQVVLDGEMVVRRADGTSDFYALLKDVANKRSDRIAYYVFGYSVSRWPRFTPAAIPGAQGHPARPSA